MSEPDVVDEDVQVLMATVDRLTQTILAPYLQKEQLKPLQLHYKSPYSDMSIKGYYNIP
jgi:hypothetical protein